MRFMMLVRATDDSEAGVLPSSGLIAEMGRFNEQLVRAGVLLAAEGLHPTSRALRVRFSGGTRTVVEGPFPHTGELLAGFWLIQARSRDEALAWVQRIPDPGGDPMEVELRQVFEAEDFGEAAHPLPERFEGERRIQHAAANGAAAPS